MEEGKPGNTCEKFHHTGTGIKRILPRSPRLQRRAGNVKHLGGLTLGYPLSLSVAIRVEPLSALGAIPSLLALSLVTLCVMDDSAHSYLLPKRMPCEKWMAKDGEVATSFQALSVLSYPFSEASSRLGGRHRDRGPSATRGTVGASR